MRKGNKELIREINRTLVLNLIKNHGPISRIDLAGLSGLSAASITVITAELIECGFIFEKEEGDSQGGRRPILLALNPRGSYMVGLKLTEQFAIGALTDLEATVIANHSCRLKSRSVEEAINAMVTVVKTLSDQGGMASEELLGIGLGLAGIVHGAQGILRHSPIFGWRDVPLKKMLQDRVGAPVYLDNDVNTLTLTELWFGAGQGLDHFLTVTIGRGVGLGIVINGQLYQGAFGGAGEFGHTVVDPEGPPCACGKQGCLETYVSDPALMLMVSEVTARGEMEEGVETVTDLLTRANGGDISARKIYAKAGEMLGIGIANLITIFSPELIIISGEGVKAGDWIFDPMRISIARNVMPGLAEDTEIRIDVWDDDAWARGAASLVLKKLFESPMHREVVELSV